MCLHAPRLAFTLPTVNYFYDQTAGKEYSADDEGTLVQLCDQCADAPLESGAITLAQRGDETSGCERCDATQDDLRWR